MVRTPVMPVHPDFKKMIDNLKFKTFNEKGVDLKYTQITKSMADAFKDFSIDENRGSKRKKRSITILEL